MKKTLRRFQSWTWSFRVNVLTLFLTLISVAFACVVAFAYPRQYASDLSFSKGVAERVSDLVLGKFDAIARSSEQLAEVGAHYFAELPGISIDDRKLTSFLLNVVKYNQNFANFNIGLVNGSFIGSANQLYSAQKTFFSDATKPLPSGTVFALRYIDATVNPPKGEAIYLDEDFHELGKEVFPIPHYDVRERPWYGGAVKDEGLYWTGLYSYYLTTEQGITVSYPIWDAKGSTIGVSSADLTFLLLSDFIKEQTIGKTGKAFIIDQQGQILVPFAGPAEAADRALFTSLVSDVYKHFLAENKSRENFVLSHDDVEYLAYVAKLPVLQDKGWSVVIVAPLDDFFGETFRMQKQVLVIIAGILLLSALLIIYFSRRISLPIVSLATEVDKIARLDFKSEVRISTNIREIFLIDSAVAGMRRAVRSFAKYVPKEIVHDLFQKNEEIVLGGEKRELTVFFSDISGFSTIAESYPLDVLIPLISEYFDAMSKIILSTHGTIDKFLGDGIMAFWGAPLPLEDHAQRACTAALRCRAMLVDLNRRHTEAGMPEFATRFGINTGTVIAGNIGTEERMNYTVIGDVVNITSRLQGIDKLYHTSILISEEVYRRLGNRFVCRPLDIVTVKGKTEKIKIYELVGKMDAEKEIEATEGQISLCKLFEEAYNAVQSGDKKRAKELFTAISQKFPEDYPTQIYLKRVVE